MFESHKPDALAIPQDERENVAAVLACLCDVNNPAEHQFFEPVLGTLGIPEERRDAVRTLLPGFQDPRPHARRITDPRARAVLIGNLLHMALSSGCYSSREREGIRRVAAAARVPWDDVVRAEDALASDLRATIAAPTAPTERAPSPGRGWKVALGILVGGAALAATGGLAAPALGGAIGTYFLGLSGAAATSAGLATLGGGALAAGGFGMAGGKAVVAGLFGAAGATVVGRKVARRTGPVEEFALDRLGGDGMHVVLTMSGFLSEGEDQSVAWACLSDVHPRGERYSVRWESQRLRGLGTMLLALSAKQVAKAGAATWAARAGSAALGRLVWPKLVLDAADVIDNPWHMAADRAEKTGIELAASLAEHCLGRRPVSLLGFSLGGRVILHALEELNRRGVRNAVHHAVVMGGAVSADAARWERAGKAAAGQLVNAYSSSDWVLAVLYRLVEAGERPAGLGPIASARVRNVDVSDLAPGHLDYRNSMTSVLHRLSFDNRRAPTHEEIAHRAYGYWRARGGSEVSNWLQAEQDVWEEDW